MHVLITVCQKCSRSGAKKPGSYWLNGPKRSVHCRASFWIVMIVPLGIVRVAAVGHLFRGQAEQEEVFLAGFFRHFDGRAVAGADGQRTVHHEFHVARAAGFVAGGGNLLGNIAGRDESLR